MVRGTKALRTTFIILGKREGRAKENFSPRH